jgi:hypothetical protein
MYNGPTFNSPSTKQRPARACKLGNSRRCFPKSANTETCTARLHKARPRKIGIWAKRAHSDVGSIACRLQLRSTSWVATISAVRSAAFRISLACRIIQVSPILIKLPMEVPVEPAVRAATIIDGTITISPKKTFRHLCFVALDWRLFERNFIMLEKRGSNGREKDR